MFEHLQAGEQAQAWREHDTYADKYVAPEETVPEVFGVLLLVQEEEARVLVALDEVLPVDLQVGAYSEQRLVSVRLAD